MSSGDTHEFISKVELPFVMIFLYLINASIMTMILCFVLWVVHALYVTPDDDTESKSSHRLGLIGKITVFLFHHRGIWHSWIAWTVLFVIEYHYVGLAVLGGATSVYSHLMMDFTGTWIERKKTKIKRAMWR